MTDLRGDCHCGALGVSFHTDRPLDTLPWRRCGCDFCRRHGAVYTSDSGGRLTIEAKAGALSRYRFGQKTADFLICAHCGVLVAVTAEIEGRLYGGINLAGIAPTLAVPAEIPTMDFSGETVEARTARRQRNWIGSVDIRITS